MGCLGLFHKFLSYIIQQNMKWLEFPRKRNPAPLPVSSLLTLFSSTLFTERSKLSLHVREFNWVYYMLPGMMKLFLGWSYTLAPGTTSDEASRGVPRGDPFEPLGLVALGPSKQKDEG